MEDGVDYFTKIKEEILCEDSKPLLIKEEPLLLSIDAYVFQPQTEFDVCDYADLTNETIYNQETDSHNTYEPSNAYDISKVNDEIIVNLKDVNKTIISTSSNPMKINENYNQVKNVLEKEKELLNSTLNSKKKINHIPDKESDISNESVTKSFFVKKSKTLHMCHVGERPHSCQICKRTYKLKHHLLKHIMLIHPEEKPHKCQVCKTSFRDKCDLKRHMLIHAREKQHECHICKKLFTEKCNKKRDILIHTGESTHKCQLCKKSYKSKGNLERHMLSHIIESTHICQVCKRSYKGKGYVKRQVLILAGRRQQYCQVHSTKKACEAAYAVSLCTEETPLFSENGIH